MKIFSIILILLGLSACGINQPIVKIEQNQQVAEKVDNKPMLRLNTQMHTAPIRRMSIDAQQRFLVTGSDDKTARVWDLQTGDLLQVLRPPIGEGNEGKISMQWQSLPMAKPLQLVVGQAKREQMNQFTFSNAMVN